VSDLPQGFYVGNLYCFQIGKQGAATFGYLPGPPRIESVGGRAKASLLSSPEAGVLSVQSVWTADPHEVEAAQREIIGRAPEAGSVTLRVAPLSGTRASLTLSGADGTADTFGPNASSGPDAFRAVFSETLTRSQKEAAIGAFRGQTGVLQLQYEGLLELEEVSRAELSGDLAEEMKALAPKQAEVKPGGRFGRKPDPEPLPPPDPAACAQAVERAIRNQQLTIVHADTPNVSSAARQKVDEALRQAAARLLHAKLEQLGADAAWMASFSIRQEAQELERVSFRVSGTCDPAEWLARNGGSQLVTGTIPFISDPKR
jgi:hypothetical protein